MADESAVAYQSECAAGGRYGALKSMAEWIAANDCSNGSIRSSGWHVVPSENAAEGCG